MENHSTRLPAQEFAISALKSNQFLGAIKIRRLKENEPGFIHDKKKIAYKIEDGFVSLSLLKQFSHTNNEDLVKTVKLYGLEDQAAHYLSRAIIFARAEQEGGVAKKLLGKIIENQYHHYASSPNPTQTDRVRTPYQEKFDALSSRHNTILPKARDKRKILSLRRKNIFGNRFKLLDPDSLRHYHKKINIYFLQTQIEYSGLQHLYIQRLQTEKQNRMSENNFSYEISRFTNFSGLPLDAETKQYAIHNYSHSALKKIESLKKNTHKSDNCKAYLSFIKNMFDYDEILSSAKIKSISEKIHFAINEMYCIDFDSTNLELTRLFNNYYRDNKPLPIQNFLIKPIITAVLEKNSLFFSNSNFSKTVQLAISQLNKKSMSPTYYFNKTINDSFLENLKWSLEFIDTTNILTVIHSPNSDVYTAPWRSYQNKNELQSDRHLNAWKRVANKRYKINLQGLNELFEDLTQDEKPPYRHNKGDLFSKMRDHPIIAGGGLDKTGDFMPPHILTDRSLCTQYFRITEEQLNALKINPFITVLEEHSCDNIRFGANYVIKYRYPDCRDAEQLAQQYSIPSETVNSAKSLLSELVPAEFASALWKNTSLPTRINELTNEQFSELIIGQREYRELIDIYQRNLNNPSSYPKPIERRDVLKLKDQYESKLKIFEEYKKKFPSFFNHLEKINLLTNEALYHLLKEVTHDKSLSAIERYQKLVSIHPFQNMNGRSLRMFYRQEQKKPLYMLNWDLDIVIPLQDTKVMTPANDFNHFGFNQYISIVDALHKTYFQGETQNLMPKYYDSTEFVMSIFDIDYKHYTKAELNEFRGFFSKFYLSNEIQQHIEKKSYHDYMHHIMEHIFTWDKFKFNSYLDINKNTPLHIACLYHFSKKCIKKLLVHVENQKIIFLHLKNNQNQNPAHIAAQSLNIEALSLLWQYSPELFQQLTIQGESPFDKLSDKLQSQISTNTLTSKSIDNFIKFFEQVNTSQYPLIQHPFENNTAFANFIAKKNNKTLLNLMFSVLQDFSVKQDDTENPIEDNKNPNTRRNKNIKPKY